MGGSMRFLWVKVKVSVGKNKPKKGKKQGKNLIF
jgi:hypothetical protein